MKRFNNVLPAVFLFFISAVLFAATPEFQWGGPGYDPILRESKDYTSSRYTVRLHPSDKEAIDILVDAKETVREVGRMNLIAADKTTVSSETCWRSMRHASAPWACTFKRPDLRDLAGVGEIATLDKAERVILKDTAGQ